MLNIARLKFGRGNPQRGANNPSNHRPDSAVNHLLTTLIKPFTKPNGGSGMIRQLYDLEDWLFYRSRTCAPAARRIVERLSRSVGHVADRLEGQVWRGQPTGR
ncbi:MAG: hypothetical protein B7Y80_03980 [Hyphomicrobium sp. 32-62-53]|nr:MAG: hypothetical protein B7Z29_06285 [Hyphomicrobium sp. 12-62-95]OYY01073.1 MAG: hypothetical protein B7Y80_03980 [Hyphomicrobium sp. 32-62-53]